VDEARLGAIAQQLRKLSQIGHFVLGIAGIPLLSVHTDRDIAGGFCRAPETLQPMPGRRHAWNLPPNTFETFP